MTPKNVDKRMDRDGFTVLYYGRKQLDKCDETKGFIRNLCD